MTGRSRLSAMHLMLIAFLSFAVAADQDAGTKFAVAIEDHDVDAVKALLQSGLSTETPIDYGEHSITPLIKAAWDGDEEIVKALLAAGAKVNAKAGDTGETALINAGKADAVQALVDLKADVNAKTKDGDTPLKVAMKGDQDDIAKILKTAGAKK